MILRVLTIILIIILIFSTSISIILYLQTLEKLSSYENQNIILEENIDLLERQIAEIIQINDEQGAKEAKDTDKAIENEQNHQGYIKKIDFKDNKYYLDLDYVDVWPADSEQAKQALVEEGSCESIETCTSPSPIYISNVNSLIRTFEINQSTEFYILQSKNDQGKYVYNTPIQPKGQTNLEDFIEYIEYFINKDIYLLYSFKINNNKIELISEYYTP